MQIAQESEKTYEYKDLYSVYRQNLINETLHNLGASLNMIKNNLEDGKYNDVGNSLFKCELRLSNLMKLCYKKISMDFPEYSELKKIIELLDKESEGETK